MTYSIDRLELGLMQNHVYLLYDHGTGRIAVIDPAWDVPAIVGQLRRIGGRLTDILITHCHDDHTNGAPALLARYPEARLHYTEQEARIWPDAPDGQLHSDGAVIEVGATPVEVIHTPGHSPGSACFGVGNDLFTGDTLFVYGCGRCDLPGGDAYQMFRSLQRLVHELPGDTVIHPGHNYGVQATSTMDEQLWGNPFLHINRQEDFVQFRRAHSEHRQPPYRPVPPGARAW